MSTVALVEFLTARIAEDEATADQKHDRSDCDLRALETFGDCSCGYPTRVLAECATKRRIVEAFIENSSIALAAVDCCGPTFLRATGQALEHTLRTLASVYADHPYFDPEWAS